MGKISLFILLFLVGIVTVTCDESSSCEEGNNKQLVCSEEVLEAIKREQAGLPPLPPKNKIKHFETTAAPEGAPEAPTNDEVEEPDAGGDEYEDGEYYE